MANQTVPIADNNGQMDRNKIKMKNNLNISLMTFNDHKLGTNFSFPTSNLTLANYNVRKAAFLYKTDQKYFE